MLSGQGYAGARAAGTGHGSQRRGTERCGAASAVQGDNLQAFLHALLKACGLMTCTNSTPQGLLLWASGRVAGTLCAAIGCGKVGVVKLTLIETGLSGEVTVGMRPVLIPSTSLTRVQPSSRWPWGTGVHGMSAARCAAVHVRGAPRMTPPVGPVGRPCKNGEETAERTRPLFRTKVI
jgi:hypothetical protein